MKNSILLNLALVACQDITLPILVHPDVLSAAMEDRWVQTEVTVIRATPRFTRKYPQSATTHTQI